MKKLLSFVLALVMVTCMLSTTAFAAPGVQPVGTSSEITVEEDLLFTPFYVDASTNISLSPGVPGFSKTFNMNGRLGSGNTHNAFKLKLTINQGTCGVKITSDQGYSYTTTRTTSGTITITNCKADAKYTVYIYCPSNTTSTLKGSYSLTSYVN